jgi:hypothetical protein
MPEFELITWANWSQIVGVLLSAAAIAYSIWTYRRSNRRRALSCTFRSSPKPDCDVVAVGPDGKPALLCNGCYVQRFAYSTAIVINSGTDCIKRAEIYEPLTFTFASDVNLIGAPRIVERRPKNIGVFIDANSNTFTVGLDLLNPREEVSVQFVHSGRMEDLPDVTARIEGISEIDFVSPPEIKELYISLALVWILMVMLLWALFRYPSIVAHVSNLPLLLSPRAVVTYVVLLLIGAMVLPELLRKWRDARRRSTQPWKGPKLR